MNRYEYRFGAVVADLQTNLWPSHVGHNIVGRQHIRGRHPCAKLICSCGARLSVTEDQLCFDITISVTEFNDFVHSLPLLSEEKPLILLPSVASAA